MAGEELEVVRLRNDFYRDGFYRVFIALLMIILAIVSLATASIYLYLHKPPPVIFYTDSDLRAFPPVPVTEPYMKQVDLIQWASDVIPAAFTFDFVNYDQELKNLEQYFTPNGWEALKTQLNIYANQDVIQTSKLFVNAHAAGAPIIPNQGVIDGRYGWWVQMPIDIKFLNTSKHYDSRIVVQILIIRVPTLDNLTGISIDNVLIPTKEAGEKKRTNG